MGDQAFAAVIELLKLLGVFFGLLGLNAWWSVCRLLLDVWLMRRRGGLAVGMVVEHVRLLVERSGPPPIRFLDQLGNPRTFAPGLMSSWKRVHGQLPVGTDVEVLFLPEDPDQVRLLSDTEKYGADKSIDAHVNRFMAKMLMPSVPWLPPKVLENAVRRKLRKRGIRTIGTVVSQKYIDGEDEREYLAAKIRFEGARGEQVEFVDRLGGHSVNGTQRGLHPVGGQVSVAYWPEEPHRAVLAGTSDVLRSVWGGFLGGLVMIGIALLVFFANEFMN